MVCAPVREAILCGRLPRLEGPAEEQVKGVPARAASRVWLGALPGPGRERPALSGQLVQDTYIRVILPVPPQK